MATRLTSNRRALGDISNRPTNSDPKLVKIHRPITRKFGADIAKNQLRHGQEKENHDGEISKRRSQVFEVQKTKSARVEGAWQEHTRKDSNASSEGGYSSESSMSIETESIHSAEGEESNLQGIREIEMTDAESPLPNIDKGDTRNPLAVIEYVEDIYSFYRDTEIISCVPADYMLNQTDINHRMRAVLVDWLIEVHHKFELMHETLFLAINLIDRYLSGQGVTRKFLQLVGITGMLIACKYEEIFPPQVSDFIAISAGAYTREDVLKMEKSMLNNLQFKLTGPTAYVFMRRFLKAAESDNGLEAMSFYLLELCLVDYHMLRFPPSLLSAAAIYTGRCMLRKKPTWNKSLRHHCTYTEEQLQECVHLIEGLHKHAGGGKLTAAYRKYSISKYNCVSTLKN